MSQIVRVRVDICRIAGDVLLDGHVGTGREAKRHGHQDKSERQFPVESLSGTDTNLVTLVVCLRGLRDWAMPCACGSAERTCTPKPTMSR